MAEKKKGVSLVGLIFFFILLIGIIIGCFVYVNMNKNVTSKENSAIKNEVKNETEKVIVEEEKEEEEVYFGINGYFLGSFKENKWYSSNSFKQENACYKINMPSKVMEKTFKVETIEKIPEMYGYDESGFLGKQKGGNIIYSEGEEEYRTIDSIRLKYDEILTDVEENKTHNLILTSKQTSPFMQNIKSVAESEFVNYDNYVKAVLDNKNLNLPVKVKKVIKGDFDLDEIEEIIIAAETERDKDGEILNKEGAYSFVIFVKENDISIIMERTRTKEEISEQDIGNYFEIREVFVTDLNKNGNVELMVETCLWDIPEVYMFEYDGERFELIEYGCFAW